MVVAPALLPVKATAADELEPASPGVRALACKRLRQSSRRPHNRPDAAAAERRTGHPSMLPRPRANLSSLIRVVQITDPLGNVHIFMYVWPREHPPPHFHAYEGDDAAQYLIETGKPRKGTGQLRRRSDKVVQAWAKAHQAELQACWDRAMSGTHPGWID